jgi:hypothetical protein
MSHNEIVPILQMSIGPVILISGVGLLLLTLTNRFGRLLDRARLLDDQLARNPGAANVANIRTQIRILMRRSGILKLSITLNSVTVLLDAVLMLVLFVAAWFHLDLGGLIAAVFATALLCLIGGMLAFLKDMNLALEAIRLEVRE